MKSFFCIIFLALQVSEYATAKAHVVFLNPAEKSHPFWSQFTKLAQVSATSLDLKLTVIYSNDSRKTFLKNYKQISQDKKKEGYDYLVTVYMQHLGQIVLEESEKIGLKTMFVNSDIRDKSVLREIKKPREVFKHWIGHIYPDDYQGAFDLASQLILKAENQVPGMIGFIGISGDRDTGVATERARGFIDACDSRPRCKMNQTIYQNNWNAELAGKKAVTLADRHPNTVVFAMASDAMALEAKREFSKIGKQAGKDIYLGGFDWQKEALLEINKGSLEASVGGHFMEGAWAMVLIKDYHMGKDFNKILGTTFKSPMALSTKANLSDSKKALEIMNRSTLDFKKLSRWHNKKASYDFSIFNFLGTSK